jgi:hypothetical protein
MLSRRPDTVKFKLILVLKFALFGYNYVKSLKCCTNVTIGQQCLLFLRRQNLLNTHLVDQVLPSKIDQVCPFLVIGQMSPDTIDHHHNERVIDHIHPVSAAHKLIRGVSHEWTVRVRMQGMPHAYG